MVAERPDIDLRISASTDYAMFKNDDFDVDVDVVYGEPRPAVHEQIPLLIEELTPMCSPAMAKTITSIKDLYARTLIQSNGQSVQWKGWFAADDLLIPNQYGLAFDKSSMGISAALDDLGVVLESTFLAQRELASGAPVCSLIGKRNSARYVGHYLVHPRAHRKEGAFVRFKAWLLSELDSSGAFSANLLRRG